MSELIPTELVDLDLSATTKEAAVRSLAARMVAAGRVTDLDGFLADVAAREAQMPTGLEGGIGIPHCRSHHVTVPTLAFGRSGDGIDFGATDGPADLVFLIAAPAGGDADHLTILSGLARRLMDEAFTGALRTAGDPATAAALVAGEGPTPANDGATTPNGSDTTAGAADGGPESATATSEAAPAGTENTSEPASTASATPAGQEAATAAEAPATTVDDGAGADENLPVIVAVTSCPTGIAHTYMAAESLEKAGREAGVRVLVETQGSAGFTRLDPAVIAEAEGVVLAHDVEVRERERFAGKATVDVGVKAAVNRPGDLLAEVRAKAARGEFSSSSAGTTPVERGGETGDGYGTRLRKWLMTGVSYMVPFVAAGGLLMALAFAVGGYRIDKAPSVAEHFLWTDSSSWAALLFQIGNVAFTFLVPVLAGFIAYSMADRPGLVPGFVGGAIALTVNAGFLGGLVAGLLAGAVVMAIQRLEVPAVLRGIMPVVVIPLFGSAVVGFLMFLVMGKPVASLQSALTHWLSGLSGSNAVILGVVLGLMMCFDLGGPLNKVAYAFAVGGLAHPDGGSLKVMAAVMAAGMVPPLGMALATVVRGRLFTRAERENGKAAWVLGASFITEGAIPFAAGDPLRVIPSAMAGGAVTGGLSMLFGCTLRAPHGGIFVVPLIGRPLLYLVAVAVGVVLTALVVVLLKSARARTQVSAPADDRTGAAVPGSAPETAVAEPGPSDTVPAAGR